MKAKKENLTGVIVGQVQKIVNDPDNKGKDTVIFKEFIQKFEK